MKYFAACVHFHGFTFLAEMTLKDDSLCDVSVWQEPTALNRYQSNKSTSTNIAPAQTDTDSVRVYLAQMFTQYARDQRFGNAIVIPSMVSMY